MRLTAVDQFCADCGMAAPLELEVAAPGLAASRHAIAQPFAVFGRSPEATLCLEDEAVSQRHVYLQVVHGRPFVIDLESRSRMRLDDQPVAAGWLVAGEPLGLGPFSLTLTGGGPRPVGLEESPLEDELRGADRARLASFDVYVGDRLQAKWRMNRAVALVGRSTRCRVRLPDPSVSRIHCAMVATPGGVWLVDLLSREGTTLGGELVQFTRLEEGDRVEIGIYRLRIRYHQFATTGAVLRPARSNPSLPVASLPMPAPPVPAPPAPVVVMGNSSMPLMPVQNELVAADSPLVGALVQQFSQMQQFMFDQFQQTLVMMAQMMTSMQQEHAALVREEMRQFQRATEELQELKRRVAEAPPPAPPTPAPPVSPSAAPQAAPATVPPPTPPPPPGRWAPGNWPPTRPPVASPSAREPEAPLEDEFAPTIALTAPTAAQAENKTGPAEEDSDAVHAWLSGRIAQLESERQSRWQKILGFLRGG